jgi:hypothetical protein
MHFLVRRDVRAAIGVALVAGGCQTESPSQPPPAVPSRAVEPVVAANVKSPAERSAPVAQAETPVDEHGRYGPKVHTLPLGCAPAGEKFSCNPLTNAGCNSAEDEACDDDDHDSFACFPESENVKEGGECNDKEGPACAAGMTCDPTSKGDPRGICRKFCCSHSDCNLSKKCATLDKGFGSLGVCK